jgi:hypothetical protein
VAFSEAKIQKAFSEVIEFLRPQVTEFMLVGAIALSFWGKVRATADIDFLLQLKTRDLDRLLSGIPGHWMKDLVWAKYNPLIRHLQSRLIVQGIIVDLMLPRDAHDRRALKRKKKKKLWNKMVVVASPEDLILMKMKSGRPHDFDDATSVIASQKSLDRRYIRGWARRLGLHDEFRFLFR